MTARIVVPAVTCGLILIGTFSYLWSDQEKHVSAPVRMEPDSAVFDTENAMTFGADVALQSSDGQDSIAPETQQDFKSVVSYDHAVDNLLALHKNKAFKKLLEELRNYQYSDPYFIEDLFLEYLNADDEKDRERLWAFMNLLKDEAIATTLADALSASTGEELVGWLKVVPDTAAFANSAVREQIMTVLHESDEKDLVVAALGTLNPALSEGIDRAMVTSAITKHMTSADPDLRIAAYEQQARWFDEADVKEALATAFQDPEEKVKIAAMSILEASNIKDESFRSTLTAILAESEKGSDLYNYSLDTLAYYYGYSDEQLASIASDGGVGSH